MRGVTTIVCSEPFGPSVESNRAAARPAVRYARRTMNGLRATAGLIVWYATAAVSCTPTNRTRTHSPPRAPGTVVRQALPPIDASLPDAVPGDSSPSESPAPSAAASPPTPDPRDPPAAAAGQPRPTDAETRNCAARGGTIEPVCMLGEPACVVRYRDGGKRCRDKRDCTGECLYEGPDPPASGAVGNCQRTSDPCGCKAPIHHGHVEPALCVD